MTPPTLASVSVGDELAPVHIQVTRADLIRYAGASGDFNVIHWNERVATAVGLPNVIAHGMLTMGAASRVATEWIRDPGRVVSYSCRFTRPVVVPDDEAGASIEVTGSVTGIEGDLVTVAMKVVFDGSTVLGKPTIVVRLSA
ncbi:MAG: dehydratase [Actinobacteria bacterium]|nr:dehydratase [Actinomycetota bacterium]